ncbi:MAG: type II toxin-antitoxin system HicB family antitoxin [Planctomycetota bacterium]
MKFTAVITADPESPGAYNASVPALPGCHSWGRTRRQALKNVADAARCVVESMLAEGEPVPQEVETREVVVR